MDYLRQSIADLRQEELKYDQHIKMVNQSIRRLYEEEAFDKDSLDNFCYVTHDDMRREESFADQSVMAIKAPPGTTLEVPDPDEGMPVGKRRFQVFLKSTGRKSCNLQFVFSSPLWYLSYCCSSRWARGCVFSSTNC